MVAEVAVVAESAILLTIDEVATRLRMSKPSVYRLLQSKKLAYFKVGAGRGATRIALADLNDYLIRQRVGAAGEAPTPKVTRRAPAPLNNDFWFSRV
jgi:excisionase family DNA binding protein